MMTRFNMTRDINGYNGFGLSFSNQIYTTALTQGIEQTLTVPASQDATYPRILAIFSFQPGATVFVALNQTALFPGASFSNNGLDMNPSARYVQSGDVLHFVTNDPSNYVEVAFYAVA